MRHCPVCHTPSRAYSVGVYAYRIFKCAECGLEYADPMPTDSELVEFYKTYTDIRADVRVSQRNARTNFLWLRDLGAPTGEWMLDFGYGNGAFRKVAECCGAEIGQSLLHRGYRAITMWGVLEHLPRPVETMRMLSGRLLVGGIIALTTVDAEGDIPYHYKPPEHLTYWTRAAMRWLAIHSSLELVSYEPYEMEQLSEVYLNRLLARTPSHIAEDIVFKSEEEFVKIPTNECRVLMRKI